MSSVVAFWASGLYTPMAMIAAACARRNAGAAVERVVVVTPDLIPFGAMPYGVEVMHDGMSGPAHHYVRKPTWWAELLEKHECVVGLDADAMVLGSLSDAIEASVGRDFAAVVADSSYMMPRESFPASCGVPWARSDVRSRLELCPDKGRHLRSFFMLPPGSILQSAPYFSVAFMFMRPTSATIQTMRRTAEYGLKVPQARHFSVWPENTPMNCAAIELDAHWSELHPAQYSSIHAHPDKRIWHMDGHKPGRHLREALGEHTTLVASACSKAGLDLTHPYFKDTW